MADLKKEVEAILFSAGRTVELRELQKLLHVSEPGLVKETIRELKEEYEQKDSPLMILSEQDGWKLTVKEKYLKTVQKINPHTELSKTILETLSVIAWKQPVLQSEVIKIRTNKAYDHISELERLGFISKERHGRSFMLKVTQKFLDYFDLPDADAIKDMFSDFKDIEVAVQKKAGELEKGADKPDDQRTGGEGMAEEERPDKTEKADDSVEGVELEPYVDVPPDMPKPHPGPELETYQSPPPGAEEGKPEEDGKEEGDEDAEEGSEGEEPQPEETEEEKAKRIARELLEEEQKKEKEGEEPAEERKLHPKLEHFIEGEEEHLAPKPTEKHEESEEGEDKEEKPEEEGEESGGPQPEEGKEEHEDAEAGDAAEKEEGPPKAEEYPGQFAQEGDKDSGEGEGKEEEDEKT